jgi:hypothetical protein
MNAFWILVNFEYKKIIRKRSVQITVLLALMITAFDVIGTLIGSFYVEGKPYETYYDAMIKDRSYMRALSGRLLDGKLIMETVEAYAQIPEANDYQETKEYQTIARPFSGIYSMIRGVYNTDSKRFNMEDFQKLTTAQASQFYTTRNNLVKDIAELTRIGNKAEKQVLAWNDQVKTPFTISHTDGYIRFFQLANMLGFTASFVMAICVAPLFSGEYVTGADQLILSSKHGKNKIIAAKLFTGFSVAAVICLLLSTLTFCLSLFVFGADGGNAPLQLYIMSSPYALTMGQTTLVLIICVFLSCIMTAAITMLLSAKLKAPFGVIILVSVLLFAPMMGSVSSTNLLLYRLYHLLPTQMSSLSSALDMIPYELPGLVLKPYCFLPLFAAAVSILLTPLAYRSFKNHQIG